ncbi:MAG: SLBB domain-containing protein [Bacteroidales bacterium]|nr:SLBB domain-containing protein [Bacteroidales bacterium]
MKIRIILILFLAFLAGTMSMAQDINNVNVQSLSDKQINQIVQKIQSSGMTMEQAIALAKARGASQEQINQLMARIQGLNSNSQGTQSMTRSPYQTIDTTQYPYSTKAVFQVNPRARKVFGYKLFNNDKLSFAPSVNLPTPHDYVLGTGDQLMINVWGASQQTYQLTVDNSGAVYIPSLGPIYVAGMNFDKATDLIKKRLTDIYRGLSKPNPNTWAVVTLSELRGIRVNIIGEANAPGTYTLPATATVFNALYLSGGPNQNGSFRNIELIRDNKVIKTIDVYDFLISGSTQGDIQLRNQDVIFIPTYQERVETSGNFKRDNLFEMKKGETLSDLINYAGGFTPGTYKSQLSVYRLTNREKEIVDVNESNFNTFPLQNGDSIVAGKVLNRFTNRVFITGAVYRPGAYELTGGMTLGNLIAKADGVMPDAYSNRGLIIREKKDLTKKVLSFEVDSVLRQQMNIKLQREDSVVINTIDSMRNVRYINISGEVRHPGKYVYYDNMSVNDLVFLAGGFTEAASGSYVEISRRNSQETAESPNSRIAKVFTMNIDKSLKLEDGKGSFELKPFDNVFIRKAPSYYAQKNVEIQGEVVYPGKYSITSKNERVSDLLERAGGLDKFAYAPGATLKREKALSDVQKQKLRQISLAADTTLAVDSVQLDSLSQKYALVELDLPKILKNPGGPDDYVLKEGDIINIPEVKQTVTVTGAVMNPITLSYIKGESVRFYIRKSGGFSQDARRSKTYVIYANGTSSTGSWINVQPGSQIVVPQKPVRKSFSLESVARIFSILVSALTTAILATKL